MAAMLVAGSAALVAEPARGKNAPAPEPGIAVKVLDLTGAETRIVWIRHKQWEAAKPNTLGLDGGAGYSIMAFDTGGKGERELVPEGEIYNPLISPSGGRVIYSATTDGKLRIHCVDWNGANMRILGDGFAQWPWRDPATGIEWVYTSSTFHTAHFVDRFQLHNPDIDGVQRAGVAGGGVLTDEKTLQSDGGGGVGDYGDRDGPRGWKGS